MLSNRSESWNQKQLVLSGFRSGYAIGISIMTLKCNSIISFIWFIHAFAEKKTVSPKRSFSAHSEFSREFRPLQKWTNFLRTSCWKYAFKLQNGKKSVLFSEKTKVIFQTIFNDFVGIRMLLDSIHMWNRLTRKENNQILFQTKLYRKMY